MESAKEIAAIVRLDSGEIHKPKSDGLMELVSEHEEKEVPQDVTQDSNITNKTVNQ